MCLVDPGHPIDLHVEGHVRTMIDYWMGQIDPADAVRSGDLTVEGPRALVRAMPTWLSRSAFATVELGGAGGGLRSGPEMPKHSRARGTPW